MVTIIGLLLGAASVGQATARPADLLTGPKFQVEIDQATSGAWANVELRSLLTRLSTERRVAILLDRRIDPTVKMSVNMVDQSLKDGLQDLARRMNAEISVPENVAYLGPSTATQRLRTLIELRSAELQLKSTSVRESRRTELMRRQAIEWDDLETPAEILQRIAGHYKLSIRRPELIPHDLWGGNHLPGITAAEALSLVLIQFDLTFTWVDGAQGIELIPIPDKVVVDRRHRFKGRSGTDALKLVKEQHPDLDVRLDGAELLAQGTVEQQEAIAGTLNPSTSRKPVTPTPSPLRQRTFTLTFKRAPVRAVMEELKKSKVVFTYDAAALEAAGIDLDQAVDLELNKASADDFFKSLFSPLGLSFEIDNLTVKLTPKK